jgi:hypothetical protein
MGKNLILSSIYTANQCTDVNDCDIAIERCKKLINEGRKGYERSLYKRLLSLEKRKVNLLNKNVNN